MTEFAVIVALGTLAVGLTASFALRLLPTVRMQLAGLALVGVALPLGAVLLGGLVMFHMHADLKVLEIGAASASTATVAALVVGNSIAHRVRKLELTASRLAAGDLDAGSFAWAEITAAHPHHLDASLVQAMAGRAG